MGETYSVNSRCNNCGCENSIIIEVGHKLNTKEISKIKCAQCKCDGVFTVFYKYS